MVRERKNVAKAVKILKWTYGLVPIIAGLDKFAHILVDWHKYLAHAVINILPIDVPVLMSIVGVIEVVAGIIVLVKPRVGALIVSLWLLCIVINLLLTGEYYDIAVRDLVMSVGAFSLFLLIKSHKENAEP